MVLHQRKQHLNNFFLNVCLQRHAVEDKHSGKNYSNVVYVGATPYCKKNLDYTVKQSKKFLEGKSPPDFAAEDYEINYKDRVKLKDLSSLAKKQLALEEWN